MTINQMSYEICEPQIGKLAQKEAQKNENYRDYLKVMQFLCFIYNYYRSEET